MRAEIRSTAALALPMMLGQGAQVLMHVIDTAMVGRLGTDTLAAAAMANNAATLFFLAGVALGSTVPALAARAFGAGDRARLNLVLRHGLTLSLIFSLGCVAIFAAVGPSILRRFGPAPLVGVAQPYALLLIASLVPAMLVQNLRGFAEAQNRPWLPLGNIALGVGLNVMLNLGFIYGYWGFPALGLPGAALGTLIARVVMLGHFAWVLRGRPEVAPAAGAWRPVGWRTGFYGEYLRLALPTVAITLVFFGNTVVIAAWMGRFGPVAIAANEIVRQVGWLLFSLPLGFSFAVAIRVGHAAGAGDWPRARRVAWSSVVASVAGMGIAGLLVALGSRVIPTWFLEAAGGDREAVVALTARLLAIVAWSVVANGLMLACIGAFRGLANLRAAAAIYVVGLWMVGLPLAHVLGFFQGGGGPGIWQGMVIASGLTALVLTGHLWRVLGVRSVS